MNSESQRQFLKSAKGFFSGTLLSRVSGFIREMAMATVFGANPIVAAFWMAFRFSYIFRRVLGEGALQSSFIPHFEDLKLEDPKKAGAFFRDLTVNLSLLLFIIIIFGEGILWVVVNYGGFSQDNTQILELTMCMLPGLFFISHYALNMGYLNCNGKFFLSGVAPVAFNIVWIAAVAVIYFLKIASFEAVRYLSVAIVLAYVMQWLATAPSTFKLLKESLQSPFFSGLKLLSSEIRKTKSRLLVTVIGVGAVQFNSVVDLLFARFADLSGPAYLNYALRLEQAPAALFSITLAAALLPPLSRAIKAGDYGRFSELLRFCVHSTVGLMIPCTLGTLAVALPVVNLLYGRGDFSVIATQETALCLAGYALSLLPFSIVLVLASAFYAQENYRIPTYCSIISVVVNLMLNSLFVFVFEWGAASISLATSIAAFVNMYALLVWAKKTWPHFPLLKVGLPCCKVLAVSVPAALAAYFLAGSGVPRTTYEQFLAFTIPAGAFFIIVASLSYFFKIRPILNIFLRRHSNVE